MSARIPEDVIEKIREDVVIADVVGHFLPLQRAGKDLKALCPFHQEKTPSFHVVPDKGIFYCFGCQRGGNVFRFLMDREGMSFPEAVEWCASRIGLDLSRFLRDDEEDGGARSRVLAANAWAASWMAEQLASPSGAAGREYLSKRGILPETAEAFGLGFAPAGGGGLEQAAAKAGLDQETLLRASLLGRKEGRAPFAYFRSRLIFPVRGVAQKIYGFGGRILGPGEPKYLNSPETPVFQKRTILYGLPEARPTIVRGHGALLAEGYLDALALHQMGLSNAVATCGTAFTPDQATTLARYADRVTLVFDGDAAGLKAAFKAADVALAAGMDVRIARLPAGTDPADLACEGQETVVKTLVDQAPGIVACMAEVVSDLGDRREVKERALRHLKKTVASVPDPIRRELLVQEAAAAFRVRESLLQADRPAAPPKSRKAAPSRRSVAESRRSRLERSLLTLALASKTARHRLFEARAADDFEDPKAQQIFRALHDLDQEVDTVDGRLLSRVDESATPLAARLLAESLPPDLDAAAEMTATLDSLAALEERAEKVRHREHLQEEYTVGGDWKRLLEKEAHSDPADAEPSS